MGNPNLTRLTCLCILIGFRSTHLSFKRFGLRFSTHLLNRSGSDLGFFNPFKFNPNTNPTRHDTSPSSSANDWSIPWPWYKVPHLVPFKLMELLLHPSDPIWISKSFINIFRLNGRKESIKSITIFKFRSSLHSYIDIRQNLIEGVWTLVLPWS